MLETTRNELKSRWKASHEEEKKILAIICSHLFKPHWPHSSSLRRLPRWFTSQVILLSFICRKLSKTWIFFSCRGGILWHSLEHKTDTSTGSLRFSMWPTAKLYLSKRLQSHILLRKKQQPFFVFLYIHYWSHKRENGIQHTEEKKLKEARKNWHVIKKMI